MEPVLAVAAFGVAAVALLGWHAYRTERARRQAFAALAQARGWSYAERDDRWTERFSGPPFGTGTNRRARNVLTGRLGDRPLVAFDYSYVTSSTDANGNRQNRTHRYAVCGLSLPTFLPELTVSPENVLTRIAGALGFDDVEFESEEFNRRFRVRAEDRKCASDILTPRTLQLLLAAEPLAWRVSGSDVVAWDGGFASPDQVVSRLELLSAVLDGVPSFVWRDYR